MSILKKLPAKEVFELLHQELEINPAFIEKDWYVVQIIHVISQINYPDFEIIFSGGTALSKAHKLIKRFSEDIDFRVIAAPEFKNRTALSDFRKSVVQELKQAGFQIRDETIKSRDQNRFFALEIDYDSYFPRSNALRRHVQLEMTVNDTKLSGVILPVSSFIADSTMQPAEVKRIKCLVVTENAADKLSALAWRVPNRNRGSQYDDPTIVRHIYDLAVLEPIAIADPRFHNLIKEALEQDKNRAKNIIGFEKYTVKEKLSKMIDILDSDAEYVREYDLYVKAVCYTTEDKTPTFSNAIEAIKRLSAFQ